VSQRKPEPGNYKQRGLFASRHPVLLRESRIPYPL